MNKKKKKKTISKDWLKHEAKHNLYYGFYMYC